MARSIVAAPALVLALVACAQTESVEPSGGGGKSADAGADAPDGSGGGDAGTDASSQCGDLVRQGAEECDNTDFGGMTCLKLGKGFGSGDLSCTSQCTFDTTQCVVACGDGVVQLGEECDGANLAGRDCGTLGFTGGQLACTANCQLDPSACFECGDKTLQQGESCDGTDLGGATCQSLGYSGGTLTCKSNCSYDETGCQAPPSCGNGNVDSGEQCDGANLNAQTCQGLGFTGGALSCSGSCMLNTSLCYTCGDGQITPPEVCDGANVAGQNCITLGHGSGTLGCNSNCLGFNQSNCSECGNNQLDMGEQCDDGNITPGDGCDASCKIEACDPDGVYTLQSPTSASYTCCAGLVSVNVSSFIFSNNGATIQSSPSNPVTMTGAATTCPSGSFNNTGSIPGGCAESYKLQGNFTGQDTWSGTYSLTFTGSQCGCFGGALGTPCVNQVFAVTAKR